MTTIFDVNVASYLPEGQQGLAAVEHFEITKRDAEFSSIRAMSDPDAYTQEGRYTRLRVRGQLMMSDTHMEKRTNTVFCRKAKGHVLVAGLGLGLILKAIHDNPEVTHVTVVEKYQDVVDLVGPAMQALFGDRLTIVTADIFEWRPVKGTRFDTIYFDIWPDLSTDTLKEMARLHQRFGPWLAAGGWLDSWRRSDLQARKRREARQGRGLGFGWRRS